MKKLLLALIGLFAWASVAFSAVNINTATKTELESIKGIGPVKAQAIIDYRTAHGSFKSIDELDNVKGIGKSTLGKIRGDVSLSGNAAPKMAKPSVTPAAAATPTTPAPMSKKESANTKDHVKSDAGKDKKAQDKKEEKSKKAEKKADAKAKKKDAAKEKP